MVIREEVTREEKGHSENIRDINRRLGALREYKRLQEKRRCYKIIEGVIHKRREGAMRVIAPGVMTKASATNM